MNNVLAKILLSLVAFSPSAFAYNFEGTVKLSQCSGAVIRFKTSLPSSMAIVLTNGHCYTHGPDRARLKPSEIIIDEPSVRPMQVYDRNQILHPLKATRLLLATMSLTDVALYELDMTYQELYERFKITPFELEETRPKVGSKIDLISGLWDRGYSCSIDRFIYELRENGWSFKDSIRYSPGCEIIGGTSGSPLVLAGTRKIVGINNTTNDDGEECTLNNPCEVSPQGVVSAAREQSYGQQTYGLYSCLTVDFRVDLYKEGCLLKVEGQKP